MKRSCTSSRSADSHPRVVGGGAQRARAQLRGQLLRLAPRRDVDDPGRRRRARSAPRSARRLRSAPCSPWKRSTEKRRFGRSNPRISSTGSRSPSRATISSRTGGAAVAVRASTGGRPSASIAAPSRRYSGRKSWPHSLTQCASSTTNSEMSATASSSSTSRSRELLGRQEQELERVLGQLVQRVLALAARQRRVQLRRAAGGDLAQRRRPGRAAARSAATPRPSRRASAARRSGRSPTCRSRST